MRDIKRILVPSDFSKHSETAYSVAESLAQMFGAKVDFLHVVPTLVYLRESIKKLGIPFDMDEEFYPRVQKESNHRLREAFVDYVSDANQGSVKVVIDSKASAGIARAAAELGSDLIVIGARGQDESEMFRGSTSEKVIRRSDVPVFSVNERLDFSKVRTLLVPTDGSNHSLAALDMAARLAAALGASIELLHVVELYGSALEEAPRMPGESEENAARKGVMAKLAERYDGEDGSPRFSADTPEGGRLSVEEGKIAANVPVKVSVVRGVSAHYEIERAAMDRADMVVMATHGHSGLAHLVMGSTAEKVAQYVDKPVLTLRPADLD